MPACCQLMDVIIVSSCTFGSLYLCAKSLELINKHNTAKLNERIIAINVFNMFIFCASGSFLLSCFKCPRINKNEINPSSLIIPK